MTRFDLKFKTHDGCFDLKTKNSKLKTQNYLTDWHSHILPDLDDGPSEVGESLEMARILSGVGFKEVFCTPHCIKGCYDNTPAVVQRAATEMQKEIDRAGIPLNLQPGMEYYLDEYFPAQLDNPQPLGDTNLLLVEPPSQANPELIRENIFQAMRKGFTPLFAHPERYEFLTPKPETPGLLRIFKRKRMPKTSNVEPRTSNALLGDLQEMGCQFQGNLGSLTGVYGESVRKRGESLLAAGLYDRFGSDAHSAHQLARWLEQGMKRVGAELVA